MKKKLKYIKTYENKDVGVSLAKEVENLFKNYHFHIGDIYQQNFVRVFPDRNPFNETSKTQYRVELEKDEDYDNGLGSVLAFSIFLDKSTYEKMMKSNNKEARNQVVLINAAMYMKILVDGFSEVYTAAGSFDTDSALQQYPKSFGKFLDNYNISINNNKLDKVWDYSYRMYQDSKFFYYMKKEIGTGYDDFISEFVKIAKSIHS